MKSTKRMSIETEKIAIIKLLAETKDMDTIKRVKGVLLEEEPDWWDELTNDQQASVRRGLAQADRGELKAHNKVFKKYKK